jgi:hypothetical protein
MSNITAAEIRTRQANASSALSKRMVKMSTTYFQWIEDELLSFPYHPKREIVYTTYKARMCKDFMSCGKICYYSKPTSTHARWVECEHSSIPGKRMELLEVELPYEDCHEDVKEEYGSGVVHYTQIKKLKDQ